MKKAILALLCIACFSKVEAASIQWSINGLASKVLYEYDGTTVAANKTVYFVLADNLSSLTGNETKKDFEDALSAITLSTAQTSDTGTKPTVTNREVTSPLLTAGETYSFGLLYYSTDDKGDGYYKIATVSSQAYDPSDPTSVQDAKTSFTTFANASYGSEKAFSAVPEPSVALMGLLGIGMLLKRRKA